MICEYGCGQEAKHKFKNGKMCCSSHYRKCPATRESISGENSCRFGVKHTEESKKKCGIKNKGRKLSPEHKAKIVHYGKNNPSWKGGYDKRRVATYDKYSSGLMFGEQIRRNKDDKNILESKCNYCGKWFIPKVERVWDRIRCLEGKSYGECRLYCSNECKKECPIFNQTKYPKGFKLATSREVQPELRQLRFEVDSYTCQKCRKHQSELTSGLHCHHIEGIRWEPLESADIDKVITVCKKCHIEIHKQDGCKYDELTCDK